MLAGSCCDEHYGHMMRTIVFAKTNNSSHCVINMENSSTNERTNEKRKTKNSGSKTRADSLARSHPAYMLRKWQQTLSWWRPMNRWQQIWIALLILFAGRPFQMRWQRECFRCFAAIWQYLLRHAPRAATTTPKSDHSPPTCQLSIWLMIRLSIVVDSDLYLSDFMCDRHRLQNVPFFYFLLFWVVVQVWGLWVSGALAFFFEGGNFMGAFFYERNSKERKRKKKTENNNSNACIDLYVFASLVECG